MGYLSSGEVDVANFRSFTKHSERLKQFQELAKGKTKEERRKLEMEMLKPEESSPYTGPQPTRGVISEVTVKLVFPNKEAFSLFDRHFPIRKYIEQSVSDLKLLIAFLRSLEEGSLTYDKKTDRIITASRMRRTR